MKSLAAFFLLLSTHVVKAQSQKVILDKIVATVGDQIVLQSDVANLLEDDKRLNSGKSQLTACHSVDQLISNKILLSQAENYNVQVTEEELENQLNRTINYYIQQLQGEAEFERQAGKSIQAFKEESRPALKEKMLIDAMLTTITGRLTITPSETAGYFYSIPDNERPLIETKYVIDQLVYYPQASKEMHEYVISELKNYKDQIGAGKISFERMAALYSDRKQVSYELKRNDKAWDAGLLSSVFRLREGEVSVPLKSGSTYYLVKAMYREGDVIFVQIISKNPAITEYDINNALAYMDTVRAKVIAGTLHFNEAVTKFSNDANTKHSISLLNSNGEPTLSISDLDKEVVNVLRNIQAGQIAQPIQFRDQQNRDAVKLIYLRSKTNPHILNLKDDYSAIASQALEIKKRETLKKWIVAKKSESSIIYDDSIFDDCFADTKSKEINPASFGF